MHLSDPAFDTLQKLLQLDPSYLAWSKAKLAKVVGISETTLCKRLAELAGQGLVRIQEFNRYHSSGISITDSAKHGAIPYGLLDTSAGQTVPEKECYLIGQKTPPLKSLPKEQKKSLFPRLGISLPSVGKACDQKPSHAPSTAMTPKPEYTIPVVKLDGQDVTPNQVHSNTLAGKLSTAAKDTLIGWKRNPYRIPWYQAFIRGIGDQCRNQWAHRVGHRKIAVNANGDQEVWKQIALTILALDVETDYFLDVAFDCCPKRFAYPTVSFLASGFLKSAVPAWVPKDQRGNGQHEESIEEIMKRSREAIDWAEAHNPAPVPSKMWFDRNWPGLWGREDNRRPQVTVQSDQEPGADV